MTKLLRHTYALLILLGVSSFAWAQAASSPYLQLMQDAWTRTQAGHGKQKPVLSPLDSTVLSGEVPISALHEQGFQVVPWTTEDAGKMQQLIALGADGIITDYPDLLQSVLRESRKDPALAARLKSFDVAAHRGGRGLRPENTLPSFESGLDQLSTTLETDTGVTTDGVSLLWHDQFLNPQSCRRADGRPYTLDQRVYIQDISMADAQKTFICDKLHFGTQQKNDLALSPVAVAFAKKEGLSSPYAPTYVAQLFRFVAFYREYYLHGAGKGNPNAGERARAAAKVRFNLETKIMPEHFNIGSQQPMPAEMMRNHSVGPQAFVDALCGAITRAKMQSRAEVQSFDFRTLHLVEAQFPGIPVYYLTLSVPALESEGASHGPAPLPEKR